MCTENKITNMIAAELGLSAAVLNPKSSLGEDLGVDSCRQNDLLMALEEIYGVEIPDQDFCRPHTVGSIVQMVVSLYQGKAQPHTAEQVYDATCAA